MTNHERAIFNAKTTGIRGLAPILNEIYESVSKLEARVAELEAKLAKLPEEVESTR
jgi:cell division protein FtsB